MPIIKQTTAPNGVPVSYHRLGRVEGQFPDLIVQVNAYVNRDSYLQGLPPSYVNYAPFDGREIRGDLEQAALALDVLAGGAIEADGDTDIEGARIRRWAALKTERDARDFAPIPVEGFALDADQHSRVDVMGAILAMQLGGETSRAWRCADNVMRELTFAQIVAAGTAIAARRQALIETSDVLYQQLRAATTPDEIQAVVWPS